MLESLNALMLKNIHCSCAYSNTIFKYSHSDDYVTMDLAIPSILMVNPTLGTYLI